MMRRLVSRHPLRYEGLVRRVRRRLPLPDQAIIRVASAANRFHQRYFQDFVFIHINKCGGTSVERALGIPLLSYDTAQMRREALGERRWAERFKFSVVRNPYDRAASLFLYRHRHAKRWDAVTAPQHREGDVASDPADVGPFFLEWLERMHDRNRRALATRWDQAQMVWIVDDQDEIALDYLCRLERLPEDLEYVAARLGRPIDAVRLNENPRRVSYDDLYTPAAREIVHDLYADDFDRLGYDRVADGAG